MIETVPSRSIHELLGDYDAAIQAAASHGLPTEQLRAFRTFFRSEGHRVGPYPSVLHAVAMAEPQDSPVRAVAAQREAIGRPWLRRMFVPETSEHSGRFMTLVGHHGPVRALAVTADGRRIVSGSDDGTIIVWDVKTAQEIIRFEEHENRITAIAVASDCDRAVSADDRGHIFLWELANGHVIQSLSDARKDRIERMVGVHKRLGIKLSPATESNTRLSIDNLDISAMGDVVIGSSRGFLGMWSGCANDHLPYRSFADFSKVWCPIAMCANTRRVIVGQSDGYGAPRPKHQKLLVWDLTNDRLLYELDGNGSKVNSACFSSGGEWAISADRDGVIRVWNLSNGKCTQQIERDARIHLIEVRSTSNGLRAYAESGDKLIVWDNLHGERPTCRTFNLDLSRVANMAISPDGEHVVLGSYYGDISMWHLDDIRPASRSTELNFDVTDVALSADGKSGMSATCFGEVTLWENIQGDKLHECQLKHDCPLTYGDDGNTDPHENGEWVGVAMSADGTRGVTAIGGQLVNWDFGAGHHKMSLAKVMSVDWPHTCMNLDAIALTQDDRECLAVADIGMIVVVSMATGHVKHEVTSRLWSYWNPPLDAAMVSSNRAVVATSNKYVVDLDSGNLTRLDYDLLKSLNSLDTTKKQKFTLTPLVVLDCKTGNCINILVGHQRQVNAVAIAKDRPRMITGSADKTLILWDTETWGKVRRFFGHAGPISDVAMNRNGSLAVSVSHFDRTIMLWSMDQDRPLAVFPCADVPTCVSVGGTDKPIVMVGFAGGQVQFFSLESK